ncbi:class I SAM-dependent methyltransferase [Phenylobacterium sp. LjRoot225]|uniref:class I SAM-dependent methyltransferase n=1 Tax=Phenylobacterium sp. LjRoot225 TaxID=3342285 RepID=UPI003ECD7FBD
MLRTRPYYADRSLSAAFYEVVTAADSNLTGDIEFYADLAPPGGSILELGAGAGRIAFALAERGLPVVGVDIAPAMLEQAGKRLAETPDAVAKRLEFRRGDMTALDLKRTFDLVICGYFTLAHLPAGAAWRNTFAVIARHLEVGGAAAIHLPLADLMRLPGPANPAALVLDEPLPGGGRLQLHVLERRFRADIGRLDQVIEYVERGADGGVLRRSPERQTYYVADPIPFAAAAGLSVARPPTRLGGVGDIWVFRKT